MKYENAGPEPQNHRETTENQPVIIEWIDIKKPAKEFKPDEIEEAVIINERTRRPIITRDQAEDLAELIEVLAYATLKGGGHLAWWTIRIAVPVAAVLVLGYGFYLGALWAMDAATWFLLTMMEAARTIAIGFLILFGAFVLLLAIIEAIRGHGERTPFEDSLPDIPRTNINITNWVEDIEPGSSINIFNIFKGRKP